MEVRAGIQDRDLRQDLKQSYGDCMFVYWFAFHGLLNLPSYNTQDYIVPRAGTTLSELSPPTSVINQEKCTLSLGKVYWFVTGQSGRVIISIAVPSSQMTLGLCQVDIKLVSTSY